MTLGSRGLSKSHSMVHTIGQKRRVC